MTDYLTELKDYVDYLDHQEKMTVEKIHQHAEMLHKRIDIKKSDCISAVQNSTAKERTIIQQKLSVMNMFSNTLSPVKAEFIDDLRSHGKPVEVIFLYKPIASRLSQLMYMDTKPLLKKLGHYFIPGKVTASDIEALFGVIRSELCTSFDSDNYQPTQE